MSEYKTRYKKGKIFELKKIKSSYVTVVTQFLVIVQSLIAHKIISKIKESIARENKLKRKRVRK